MAESREPRLSDLLALMRPRERKRWDNGNLTGEQRSKILRTLKTRWGAGERPAVRPKAEGDRDLDPEVLARAIEIDKSLRNAPSVQGDPLPRFESPDYTTIFSQPGHPVQNKPWFDAVSESPVFAGVLALIALAIGFSPRASTLGTWVCLAAAWLLLARMVYMLDHVRMKEPGPRWKITGIVSAAGLIAFTAFGLWLMQPLKSAIAAQVNSESPTVPVASPAPTPLGLATTTRAEKHSTPLTSPSLAAYSPSPIVLSTPIYYSGPTINIPTGGLNDERGIGFPTVSIPTPVSSPLFNGLSDMGTLRCAVEIAPAPVPISLSPGGPFPLSVPTHSGIANANITARNLDTHQEHYAVTDSLGSATLYLLPYGFYSITVQAVGYRRSTTSSPFGDIVSVQRSGFNAVTILMEQVPKEK